MTSPFSKHIAIGTTLLFSLSLTGTGAQESNARASLAGGDITASFANSAQGDAQRGKDLASALVFGSGPAVSEVQDAINDRGYDRYLQVIANGNVAIPGNYNYVNDVLQMLESEHGIEYFEQFHADVTSGNPYLVEETLTDLTQDVQALNSEEFAARVNDAYGPAPANAPQIVLATAIGGWLVITIGAVIQQGGVISQAVAINTALAFTEVNAWGGSTDANGDFYFYTEHGIAGLTEGLAAIG